MKETFTLSYFFEDDECEEAKSKIQMEFTGYEGATTHDFLNFVRGFMIAVGYQVDGELMVEEK